RREVPLDRLDLIRSASAGECKEFVRNAVEFASTPFHRNDGVVEARRRRIRDNRVKLGAVLGQGLIEGRTEMLRPDRRKWRHFETSGPTGEQRILTVGRGRGMAHPLYLERGKTYAKPCCLAFAPRPAPWGED